MRTGIRAEADEVDVAVVVALPPDAAQWFAEAVCEGRLCAVAVGAGQHDRHALSACASVFAIVLRMHAHRH